MYTNKQELPVDVVQQILKSPSVNKIAKQCGFMKRKPKKIYPLHILYGLFILVLGTGSSLSNLSAKIGILNGYTVSKQAVFKRMNENLIAFLQAVLVFVMIKNTNIKVNPALTIISFQALSGFWFKIVHLSNLMQS